MASGDPLDDRVILWTRVTTGELGPVLVEWRIAREPDLSGVVSRGSVTAQAAEDFTVKVDAIGLEPGTTWYYEFRAAGERSPVGRTRTLPVGPTGSVRMAFCSCANIAFGYFNAYAAIARRTDLDAVLHLGDYLYEYANGVHGDGTALGRTPRPDAELVSLADYRTRHAQYKRDADLQEMHRQHPVIAVWDDHESANNSWLGGAENHHPNAGQGDWDARRRAAIRAYLEWMPIREIHADRTGRIYRSFRFGDLADLTMLDTRLVGRDAQVYDTSDPSAYAGADRSLLGPTQEAWLERELRESKHDDVRWRVLGQQVVMAPLWRPDGRIANPDAWDGYPAARARLFDAVQRYGIDDLVVLTGDVHSSWAMDVPRLATGPGTVASRAGRDALAVEFVTPGVTSPGSTPPERAAAVAEDALARHAHVRWLDLTHRGYGLLDLRPDRAHAEWWFVDSVDARGPGERFAGAFATRSGRSHLESRGAPAPSGDPILPAP